MALEMNVVSPQGFLAKNAYIYVQSVSLINKTQMDVCVQFLKDKESIVPFKNQNWACAYNLENGNPFAQAYEYLKTLPEFEGAVDC